MFQTWTCVEPRSVEKSSGVGSSPFWWLGGVVVCGVACLANLMCWTACLGRKSLDQAG